jgi:hypothetical protein
MCDVERLEAQGWKVKRRRDAERRDARGREADLRCDASWRDRGRRDTRGRKADLRCGAG